MRKLLIKYFALSYYTRFFWLTLTFTRSAVLIVPTMAAGMYFSLQDNEEFTIAAGIMVVLLFFVPQIYFKRKPVRFYELDLTQKWFFLNTNGNQRNYSWNEVGHVNATIIQYSRKVFHNIVPVIIVLAPFFFIAYKLIESVL